MILVDNRLSKYNTAIKSVQDLKSLHADEVIIFLTTTNQTVNHELECEFNKIELGSQILNILDPICISTLEKEQYFRQIKSLLNLFSSFGLTITDAINIFLRKSIMDGGLPFELKQPRYNQETESAMQEARNIRNGIVQAKHYTSANELFEELDKEMDGE